MLPGRLGLRFALEALFLVLLAIGAGLADLRPAVIVLVMAVAWVLVALIEFTAGRIAASPTSYLLPASPQPEEGEAERVPWPPPEERTVVAPPERPSEPEQEPEPEAESEPQPESEAEREPEPEPEVVEEQEPEAQPAPRRRGILRRRRKQETAEAEPSPPPRHVKLLPRRSAPQPSRAAEEVAELFGTSEEHDPPKREESGG
jgi:outer membrane biosynthesis protein TonB